jgi:hypothetical protein
MMNALEPAGLDRFLDDKAVVTRRREVAESA